MAKNTPSKAKEAKAPALFDYGQDAERGFDNQTQDDIRIPLINLLQPMSPQVTEGDMKAGHLFNSVTEESMEHVDFVPASTRHVYIEWVPRDKGGGFVGVYELHDPVVKAAKERAEKEGLNPNQLKTEAGNELVETFELIGITFGKDGEPTGMAVIPFTSTKIKVYKGYNTRLQTFRVPTPNGGKVSPPLFAHRVHISSVQEENKHGKYWNYKITPAEGTSLAESLIGPDDPRYQAAKEVYELVKAEKASAAHETAGKTVGDSDPGEDAPF